MCGQLLSIKRKDKVVAPPREMETPFCLIRSEGDALVFQEGSVLMTFDNDGQSKFANMQRQRRIHKAESVHC